MFLYAINIKKGVVHTITYVRQMLFIELQKNDAKILSFPVEYNTEIYL